MSEIIYSVISKLPLWYKLSETFSIRIPRKLKQKIDQTPTDWNQEVQNFLTERIKQLELQKNSKNQTTNPTNSKP